MAIQAIVTSVWADPIDVSTLTGDHRWVMGTHTMVTMRHAYGELSAPASAFGEQPAVGDLYEFTIGRVQR